MKLMSASFFLLLTALFWSSSVSALERLTVIGDAYTPAGDSLLYQEFHYYSADGLDHRVVYKSPTEQKIATKTIDYRYGSTTPAFLQEDIVNRELINVAWVDNKLFMKYSIEDKKSLEKSLAVTRPLVIDAGFDNFIRDNWQALNNNERVDFYFPAPTRLSLVKLMVKKADCSYPTTVDTCFRINSSNWFIRLLLDSIELGYNSSDKRLSRFRGLGNLSDESGNGLRVDIRYRYQPHCDNESDCAVAEKIDRLAAR